MYRHAASPGRWFKLISVLVADNIGSRYRRSRAGALLAIIEPLGIIALFSLTHAFGPPHRPPFGSSVILFYATGVLPYYLFFHTSWRLRGWDSMIRLPSVTEFDLLLTQVLPEVVSKMIITIALYALLWLYGVDEAVPRDPLLCLAAMAALVVMGSAAGMITAVISSFFYTFLFMYNILVRAMMAFTGVMFVLDMMPTVMRDIAAWIPISHAITLYRSGQYVGYPTLSLDLTYMLLSMVGLAALAWLMQASTREWRLMR